MDCNDAWLNRYYIDWYDQLSNPFFVSHIRLQDGSSYCLCGNENWPRKTVSLFANIRVSHTNFLYIPFSSWLSCVPLSVCAGSVWNRASNAIFVAWMNFLRQRLLRYTSFCRCMIGLVGRLIYTRLTVWCCVFKMLTVRVVNVCQTLHKCVPVHVATHGIVL